MNSESNETGIDFGAGVDKATVTSEKIEPVVERLFNLEELIWEPLTESGNHVLDENGNEARYIFSLKEVVEDQTNKFILGEYPPKESDSRSSIGK